MTTSFRINQIEVTDVKSGKEVTFKNRDGIDEKHKYAKVTLLAPYLGTSLEAYVDEYQYQVPSIGMPVSIYVRSQLATNPDGKNYSKLQFAIADLQPIEN